MKKSLALIALFTLLVGYSAFATDKDSTQQVESAQKSIDVEAVADVTAAQKAKMVTMIDQVSERLSADEAEFFEQIDAFYTENFDVDALLDNLEEVGSEEPYVVYDTEGNVVKSGKGEYKDGALLMQDGNKSFYIID